MIAEPGDSKLKSPARIFPLYYPLALSWLFMAVEGPVSVAIISRLPNAETNTAAFTILMGLALFFESPIIDLLSTSTTLASSRQRYEILTRFTQVLIVWVTVVHTTIAFTPLYGLITHDLLKTPPGVAEAAHLGFIIMIPWSGLIGWRRFLQGIMIRNGRTKFVSYGTTLRVCMIALVGFGLFRFAKVPGVTLVSIALIASVAAEAGLMHLLSRKTIQERFTRLSEAAKEDDEAKGQIGMKDLARFHFPLTMATMVMMLGMPLVSGALDRTESPKLALAAWQVASSFMFLHRAVTFALPEIVITLAGQGFNTDTLRKFCMRIGVYSSVLVVLVVATGLDGVIFGQFLGAESHVAAYARFAYLACVLIPVTNAAMCYVRGMLTVNHQTFVRLYGIVVGISTLATLLVVGVALKLPGITVAAVSVTLAQLAELAVLGFAWKRSPHHANGRSTESPASEVQVLACVPEFEHPTESVLPQDLSTQTEPVRPA